VNKKADLSLVKELIIIIFIAIVLFGVVKSIVDIVGSKTERMPCQKSVEAQAFTRPAKGLIDSPFNLKCQKYNIEFFKDHVEIDGKTKKVTVDGKTVSKFNALTDNIVNQVLAVELAECWKQFDAGQVNIFNEEFTDIFNQHKVCFVCDEVTFNENVQKAKFEGFYDYLKNTENIAYGGKYYKFLALDSRMCDVGYSLQGNCWEAYIDADKFVKIDTHKPMIRDIAFVKGEKYLIFFVREGMRTGDTDPEFPKSTYFSYIVPASEINGQCNYHVPSIN